MKSAAGVKVKLPSLFKAIAPPVTGPTTLNTRPPSPSPLSFASTPAPAGTLRAKSSLVPYASAAASGRSSTGVTSTVIVRGAGSNASAWSRTEKVKLA